MRNRLTTPFVLLLYSNNVTDIGHELFTFFPPLWHQINTDYRSYNLLMNAIFIIGISFFQTAISIIIQCLSCQTVWITLNSYMHCIGNKLTPACVQLLRLLLQWPHMLPKPTYLHNLTSTTLFSAVNNQFNWQVDATRKQIKELKQQTNFTSCLVGLWD